MHSKSGRWAQAYWKRHPRQGFGLLLAVVVALLAFDAWRMAAIRGHFETSTFLATIAFSAAGASITVPALLLAFRPSLDRKALRRGSLVPVATMAILVWSVAFVITHNRYGPEPSLADAWTLGAAVYSDVLMVWLLIAGAWAVRADKGHN